MSFGSYPSFKSSATNPAFLFCDGGVSTDDENETAEDKYRGEGQAQGSFGSYPSFNSTTTNPAFGKSSVASMKSESTNNISQSDLAKASSRKSKILSTQKSTRNTKKKEESFGSYPSFNSTTTNPAFRAVASSNSNTTRNKSASRKSTRTNSLTSRNMSETRNEPIQSFGSYPSFNSTTTNPAFGKSSVATMKNGSSSKSGTTSSKSARKSFKSLRSNMSNTRSDPAFGSIPSFSPSATNPAFHTTATSNSNTSRASSKSATSESTKNSFKSSRAPHEPTVSFGRSNQSLHSSVTRPQLTDSIAVPSSATSRSKKTSNRTTAAKPSSRTKSGTTTTKKSRSKRSVRSPTATNVIHDNISPSSSNNPSSRVQVVSQSKRKTNAMPFRNDNKSSKSTGRTKSKRKSSRQIVTQSARLSNIRPFDDDDRSTTSSQRTGNTKTKSKQGPKIISQNERLSNVRPFDVDNVGSGTERTTLRFSGVRPFDNDDQASDMGTEFDNDDTQSETDSELLTPYDDDDDDGDITLLGIAEGNDAYVGESGLLTSFDDDLDADTAFEGVSFYMRGPHDESSGNYTKEIDVEKFQENQEVKDLKMMLHLGKLDKKSAARLEAILARLESCEERLQSRMVEFEI